MAEKGESAAGTGTAMAKASTAGNEGQIFSSRSGTTPTDFASFYEQLEKEKYEWFKQVRLDLEAEARRTGSLFPPQARDD